MRVMELVGIEPTSTQLTTAYSFTSLALFNIPLQKIRVEYQIMRRKLPEDSAFPIPYVSKHIPANGAPSVTKVYDEFEFVISH